MDEIFATLKFYERIIYADPNAKVGDVRDWVDEIATNVRFRANGLQTPNLAYISGA